MSRPILLGEAPKEDYQEAFECTRWTSIEIAKSLGCEASEISKYFTPKNLLNKAQRKLPNGHDDFDMEEAVKNVRHVLKGADNIICLGENVREALCRAYIRNFVPKRDEEKANFSFPWSKIAGRGKRKYLCVGHPSSDDKRDRSVKGKFVFDDWERFLIIGMIRRDIPDAFENQFAILSKKYASRKYKAVRHFISF